MKATILYITLITLLVVTLHQPSKDTLLQSDSGCCSIHVEQTEALVYVVTYIDHAEGWTEINLVELEQPAVDMTDAEAIQFELEEAINTYQEYCYRNH